MEQEKKEPFFKKIFFSMIDFEKYQDFALEKLGKIIRYLLGLLLIFTVIVSFAFTYQFFSAFEQATEYVKNEMPDFHYENGVLSMDIKEPLIFDKIESFPGIIIFDTQTQDQAKIEEYSKKLTLYENGILFLNDKVVLKNMASTMLASKTYQELLAEKKINSFTKQQVTQYLESYNKTAVFISIYIVMAIYLFVIYLASILVDTIILGALSFLIARIVGIKMKYRSAFSIAVHALTLPVVLNAIYIVINVLTGFEIKYFSIMYNTISVIYAVTAILLIRSNLIKRQIELMKLQEEQKNIRIELERRKQEEQKDKKENQKPEDKPEEKQKDKPNKKEEKGKKEEPDNNIGKEAEGEV